MLDASSNLISSVTEVSRLNVNIALRSLNLKGNPIANKRYVNPYLNHNVYNLSFARLFSIQIYRTEVSHLLPSVTELDGIPVQ